MVRDEQPEIEDAGLLRLRGRLVSISDKNTMMHILWEELTAGLTSHNHLLRVFIRLFAAILLGGLIGLQRVSERKPSGLRTHTLICLGTTVVLLSCSAAGLSLEGASRVIQGIVTGIGFIGAGSILRLVKSIWFTA